MVTICKLFYHGHTTCVLGMLCMPRSDQKPRQPLVVRLLIQSGHTMCAQSLLCKLMVDQYVLNILVYLNTHSVFMVDNPIFDRIINLNRGTLFMVEEAELLLRLLI